MADLGTIAQSGLLTYGGPESEAWFLSGTEKGLLTYSSSNQSIPWYFTAAEKGLLTYGRDLQGPIWLSNGAEKGLLTYGATNPELAANITGSTNIAAELELIDGPNPPPQPLPTGIPNPQRPCAAVLKDCECFDDPISNFSSEDADPALFCAIFSLTVIPPIAGVATPVPCAEGSGGSGGGGGGGGSGGGGGGSGGGGGDVGSGPPNSGGGGSASGGSSIVSSGFTYKDFTCTTWCCSRLSQEDAELCARRLAQQCVAGI